MLFNTASSTAPSTVLEDTGIEPKLKDAGIKPKDAGIEPGCWDRTQDDGVEPQGDDRLPPFRLVQIFFQLS